MIVSRTIYVLRYTRSTCILLAVVHSRMATTTCTCTCSWSPVGEAHKAMTVLERPRRIRRYRSRSSTPAVTGVDLFPTAFLLRAFLHKNIVLLQKSRAVASAASMFVHSSYTPMYAQHNNIVH